MIFYHITTPEKWENFAKKDFYEAESLHTEGFIHCSYKEQLEETLKVHFKGENRVLILTLNPTLLKSELKVEKSRNGQAFPHIFGPINKAAIAMMEERLLNI